MKGYGKVMRDSSKRLITTSVLAGLAALGAASIAGAQDASGPSTSGGSLPYISGQKPGEGADAPKAPDPRNQNTSGSMTPAPAAPSAASPAPTAPAVASPAPGAAPDPARKAAETPAATPPRAPGPARSDEPAASERKSADAPKPEPKKDDVRKIDLGKRPTELAKPAEVARQPSPPATKPEKPPREAPSIDEAETKPARPAPRPSVAERPAPTAERPGPTVERPQRPAVVERRTPPKPTPDPRLARHDAEDGEVVYWIDPYTGRPVPAPQTTERRRPVAPEGRRYLEDDESSSVYVHRPRWSPYYGYQYYRPYAEGRVLRPYEPIPPQAYYRAPQRAGENCHFHAYPVDGMRFHRDIKCHWHEDAEDTSLRYAR